MPAADGFICLAGGHPRVWFASRDEIAAYAMGEGLAMTPRDAPFVPSA